MEFHATGSYMRDIFKQNFKKFFYRSFKGIFPFDISVEIFNEETTGAIVLNSSRLDRLLQNYLRIFILYYDYYNSCFHDW